MNTSQQTITLTINEEENDLIRKSVLCLMHEYQRDVRQWQITADNATETLAPMYHNHLRNSVRMVEELRNIHSKLSKK